MTKEMRCWSTRPRVDRLFRSADHRCTLQKEEMLSDLVCLGAATGFAFPEALKAIVNADSAGDREEVRRIYQKWCVPLFIDIELSHPPRGIAGTH